MYYTLMGKVVLLFGALEVIGFIQLGDESETHKIVSACFRFLYNVIRSMRGVFLFLVLVVLCKRARKGVINMITKTVRTTQ